MHRNGHRLFVWVRSFIASYFLKQCTTQQYDSDLSDQSLWKLGLGLDSQLHYFTIFSERMTQTTKRSAICSGKLIRIGG